MIRLLLVDDQALLRQGLASLLALEEDLTVVAEASNGQEAIALAQQHQPDVILMDIRMPLCDGVAATRRILQHQPAPKVLVLTTFDEDELVWQALQAGALGYLLKDTPSEQVAHAIRTVYSGHAQLGPTIAPKVLSRIAQPSKVNPRDLLTEREVEVLTLLAQGCNNREIAQALYITEGTAKNHLTHILTQLNLRDRTQAALWAKQHLNLPGSMHSQK
ncbi:response regulator [Anthocerotibacter panamensis]|uniref:response regulator n=1 Tax=Anthocerotibacter panamensis TaxID=2857077 RepID=UPI001C401D09|nr:response regulator transcription factor [Anthocerotibacter panamensis]